jgi:glycosyltransferase involved in cell wall biosynthesis
MLAPTADQPAPPAGAGLALLGEFSRPSGLGMGARLMQAALHQAGIPCVALDVDRPGRTLPPPGMPLAIHVNPPMLPLALLRQPRRLLRGRRVVGIWLWELPLVPPAWHAGLRHIHEIWATSTFAAAAMQPLGPKVRIVHYPLAMVPPRPAALGRADFGLPEDAVLVLVSFNLASSFVRKNPLAAIAAFRQAFADRPDRLLLLKVGHAHHFPEDFATLRAAVANAPNIRIETRDMPEAEVHALTACADIVLSLHRSEGFGLVPAEAMLLARPVVATGWSGNMDFMDADSSALVPYRLVPARDPRGVLEVPGAEWAEPDIDAAAAHLRHLADNPAARAALGARGQAHATAALGPESLLAALAGLAS